MEQLGDDVLADVQEQERQQQTGGTSGKRTHATPDEGLAMRLRIVSWFKKQPKFTGRVSKAAKALGLSPRKVIYYARDLVKTGELRRLHKGTYAWQRKAKPKEVKNASA
jgi:hypothetical protein